MENIKEKNSIFKDYAEFKVEFGKKVLKKTGVNEFQKYKYFELSDFSNEADEILLKHNLVYIGPSWEDDANGKTWVVSRLVSLDGMSTIPFKVESEKSVNSNNPIQNSGASITYWRRFMKGLACEIIENDIVDASDNSKVAKPVKKVPKATKEQINMIRELCDPENIEKICEYYKVEKLEDLNVVDASMAIEKKRKANG